MKTCSRCRVEKSLDDFHRDRRAGDGRRTTCRPCAYAVRQAWLAADERRRLASQRANYHAHRARRLQHERLRDRERAARRRARLRSASVEQIDPLVVWDRDAGVCGICGKPADRADWHLDHVIPLARGGAHSYANVQVSHPACNHRKGARVR